MFIKTSQPSADVLTPTTADLSLTGSLMSRRPWLLNFLRGNNLTIPLRNASTLLTASSVSTEETCVTKNGFPRPIPFQTCHAIAKDLLFLPKHFFKGNAEGSSPYSDSKKGLLEEMEKDTKEEITGVVGWLMVASVGPGRGWRAAGGQGSGLLVFSYLITAWTGLYCLDNN